MVGAGYPVEEWTGPDGKLQMREHPLVEDHEYTPPEEYSLGKVDIMHRIEPILKENPHNITNWPKYDPEEFDNILKPGLCVFLECIMRFYNDSGSEKHWFLDSIQALANNISKL